MVSSAVASSSSLEDDDGGQAVLLGSSVGDGRLRGRVGAGTLVGGGAFDGEIWVGG